MADDKANDQEKKLPAPKAEHDKEEELGGSMTFIEHLTELRTRMIRALIALTVATVICFMYSDHLIEILLQPIPDNYLETSLLSLSNEQLRQLIQNPNVAINPQSATATIQAATATIQAGTATIQAGTGTIKSGTGTVGSAGEPSELERITWHRAKKKVIATHPIEPLMAQLKVSLIAGIFLAFPFIFYEAWMFVAPGLYKREKKFVLPLVFATWFCFVMGGLFSYFVVYGFTLSFFISITPESVDPLFRLSEYLSLTTRFLLAFGIIFEEPVVITLLAIIGLVSHEGLTKFRPYAIVILFTLAALITPPDPFSQLMCAIPLCFLYELSLVMVKFIERRNKASA